jgi:hypothetical protein
MSQLTANLDIDYRETQMNRLFQQLLSANKVREITDILIDLVDEHEIKWIPVGGRQDNIATINIGTDPAAGLTERITNAIDAVLELEWTKQGKPQDIISPRTATETWFSIPEGKLRSIKSDDFDKDLKNLAKRIKITLKDSERENNPTVEIRDNGIGIRPEDFSKTILSLHSGNKLKKLFLMGAYGQGGSTALSYNNYTVIISKPYYREKNEKPFVSWTIVRINPGDINLDKHEWFEYLVDAKNGQPMTQEVNDSVFEHGTLVKHVAMDLGKYTSAITNLTGSLWYLTHNYLFDPILPFTISDERLKKIKKDKAENRSVLGNNRRLTQGETTQYKREVPLTFRDGKVIIYYWVLSQEGTDNPRDRITGYTLASQPVIITFNGQKQGVLSNSIIKNDLKLPFLERYLVVQVECDRLDNESKRQLFSSTRESLRDTSILDEIKKLTIDTLQEDENLVILDRERKERYLKKDETEAIDKLRKRLASRINVYLKSSGGGSAIRATETKDTVKSKKQQPIPVNDPPTFLEITTPSPKEVYVGKTFSIKFKTDAHPNYFNNPDYFLAFIEPHSFGSFTGSANVVDGYGITYFKVREEVEADTIGKIALELRLPRQKAISGEVECIAKLIPENADDNKAGSLNMPNLEIRAINEKDPYYIDNKWTHDTVANVEIGNECVYIFINDSNKHLTKLIERAKQYSATAVESIKIRYREHIGFTAFMIHQNKVEQYLPQEDGHEVSSEVIEKVKQAALINACEGICGVINDFFQVIITESQEEK